MTGEYSSHILKENNNDRSKTPVKDKKVKEFIHVNVALNYNNESEAILDIGAPHCFASEENANDLLKSLSSYQKKNVKR